jgi:hypothetical protein
MSDYNVIRAVGQTLKQLLWSKMEPDGTIHSIIAHEWQISLKPPFKLITDTEPDEDYLSLYLYRVIENGEMKNRPLELKDTNILRYPPLSLNLFYLITPLVRNIPDRFDIEMEYDHLLLGKAMEILYDNAILKGADLRGVLANTAEELRIILNPISMEDINKIWSAFMRPYRLAVSYEVKVIYIDSERETGGERVRRKRLEVLQKNGS